MGWALQSQVAYMHDYPSKFLYFIIFDSHIIDTRPVTIETAKTMKNNFEIIHLTAVFVGKNTSKSVVQVLQLSLFIT